MKFVRPLYRALFALPFGKKCALNSFLAQSDFYHPIARKLIANDLNLLIDESGKVQVPEEDEDPSSGTDSLEEVKSESAFKLSTILMSSIVVAGVTAIVFMKLRRQKL